jgi:hypothetical protein
LLIFPAAGPNNILVIDTGGFFANVSFADLIGEAFGAATIAFAYDVWRRAPSRHR